MRTIVSIVVASTLAATSSSQQRLDPGRLYPVTAPVRHAGIVDVTTGRWTRGGGATKLGAQVVYDNTCTWVGGSYYAAFDWCEDAYDEGRIPSPSSPAAPGGAQASNTITRMEIGYCSSMGPLSSTLGYDIELAFWDKLGGPCLGGVQPPTPPPVSTTATAYFDLDGLGLPTSPALGVVACWLITLDVSNTGFVLASDGEGQFDGNLVDDTFAWMIRQNSTQGAPTGPQGEGFILAGEPAAGGYGACTYDIPCGTDAFTGQPCGTGLDTFDGFWVNVDGIGVGASNQPVGCANSVAQYGFGTNCYFFGHYPLSNLDSFHLRLESDGRGSISTCSQTKATSVPGCTALLTVDELSLAGVWSTTDIPRDASLAAGATIGVYLYTDGVGIGPSTVVNTTPFGTLCLGGFKRSAPTCSAASATTQPGVCNAVPMTTAVSCSSQALGLALGEDVNVQFWYRDPTAANPGNANLSNALFYTLQ